VQLLFKSRRGAAARIYSIVRTIRGVLEADAARAQRASTRVPTRRSGAIVGLDAHFELQDLSVRVDAEQV
jgi:hypothetical protein